MDRRSFLATGLAAGAALAAKRPALAQGAFRIERVMGGLDEPWGLAFLPGGGFLVTERPGRLVAAQGGRAVRLSGLPEVAAVGQGGLLDVMVPRDFAQSREVFLSFARPQGRGAGTALAVARWPEGSDSLTGLRVIFEAVPGFSGGRHFGSRIVEAPDGRLFLTIGDRGTDASAQDLGNHNGTVVRINRDGSVPGDNPFARRPGVRPEIWSYGHRNPQGATLDAGGTLWIAEHGARGGDEINRILPGRNYGWPVISYGRHYSGRRIGLGTARAGMEQPEFYWDPSIAPSGMTIHSGRMFPEWRGRVLVGSLNADHIAILGGAPLTAAGRIATSETARVRDVREGPDGSVWFLSARDGAVYRIVPG